MTSESPSSSSTAAAPSEESPFTGAYFAVLPALPSIPPSKLKETCDNLLANNNSIDGLIAWTHHRIVSLVHPQLTEPLEYLELSAQIKSSNDNVEFICNAIVEALLQETAVIGNAELLLTLNGTPIPLMDTAIPFIVTDGAAKDTFDKYGLVAISQPAAAEGETSSIISVDDMHAYALLEFERLYLALQNKSRAANAPNVTHHFREIMARDDSRFDFRLDLHPQGLWKDFEDRGWWRGAVTAILGPSHSLLKCGCVLSLPSCGMQYWHSDGIHQGATASFESSNDAPPHALCVFVPLIDLTEQTGYTEFWAGSHRYNRLLQKKGEQALPGGTSGLLAKGDALLYDYRTIHRGTANTSDAARPVCYFLYTREGYETVEDQNFVKESVFDDLK